MRLVEAVFDFDGSDGQLTLRAGDVIGITKEGDAGEWWEGTLNGITGWFPSAFCSAPFDDGLEESAVGDAAAISTGVRAIALYAFEGNTSDELSFEAGDVIVVDTQDQSWWSGKCNGRAGVFPGNFVKVLDEHDDDEEEDDWDDEASDAPSKPAMLDLSKKLAGAVARARGNTKGERERGDSRGERETPARDPGVGSAASAAPTQRAPPGVRAAPGAAAAALGDATFTVSTSHAGNWSAAEERATAGTSGWSAGGHDLSAAG